MKPIRVGGAREVAEVFDEGSEAIAVEGRRCRELSERLAQIRRSPVSESAISRGIGACNAAYSHGIRGLSRDLVWKPRDAATMCLRGEFTRSTYRW
jgi:hypothetical protein